LAKFGASVKRKAQSDPAISFDVLPIRKKFADYWTSLIIGLFTL